MQKLVNGECKKDMKELIELKKQLAEIRVRIEAFEQEVSADFTKVTVDGVDYYDTKKELTHQECLDLASKHGLRVLERWELCKLYDESECFRKSTNKCYWSASVNSLNRYNAWLFNGDYGNVDSNNRNYTGAALCVGGE